MKIYFRPSSSTRLPVPSYRQPMPSWIVLRAMTLLFGLDDSSQPMGLNRRAAGGHQLSFAQYLSSQPREGNAVQLLETYPLARSTSRRCRTPNQHSVIGYSDRMP